jgi:hypothetical protein
MPGCFASLLFYFIPTLKIAFWRLHEIKNAAKSGIHLTLFVGVAGFEPATSSTPCWRDTGLRYTPKN